MFWRLVCVLFLLTVSPCASQEIGRGGDPATTTIASGPARIEAVTGVHGFRIGESRPVVEGMLLARGYRLVPAAARGWSMWTAERDSLCGLAVPAVALRFRQGRLAQAVVSLLPRAPDSVVRDYLAVQSLLVTAHGKPKHDMRAFNQPYRWGDGHELEAIRSGRSYVWTEWQTGENAVATLLRLALVDEETIRLDCWCVTMLEPGRGE